MKSEVFLITLLAVLAGCSEPGHDEHLLRILKDIGELTSKVTLLTQVIHIFTQREKYFLKCFTITGQQKTQFTSR